MEKERIYLILKWVHHKPKPNNYIVERKKPYSDHFKRLEKDNVHSGDQRLEYYPRKYKMKNGDA